MEAEEYRIQRRKDLKRITTQMRQDAGLSQEAVAELLGCAKERIASVEDTNSQTEYSLAEMELLACFCGKHPTDLVRMSQDDAVRLSTILTEQQTGSALLDLVDCVLPADIAELYSESDSPPGDILFSSDGEHIASIADAFLENDWWDWQEGPRPALTVVCWDTRTGKIVRQRRFQHLEHLAFLNKEQIVLATARPVEDVPESYNFEGEYQLQVWNLRTNKIEQTIRLLDRVGNLAGSTDGSFMAAFFPTTTTIQCWTTADWNPCRAYELEPPARGDPDALGFTYRTETRVDALPRTRKFTSWGSPFQAHRFEWVSASTLLFGTSKRITEFDVRTPYGWSAAHSAIEHPIVPWNYIASSRDEIREIAVTEITYRYEVGESDVELWYLTPRRDRFPLETYVQMTRRYSGSVYSPRIIDDACILALIDYQTPYPWDERYHYRTRTAVCNLLSGRVALLLDAGRLEEPDTVEAAYLSPQADAIAHWVCPLNGTPRLSIQYIALAPLRAGSLSLPDVLEQSRMQRIQELMNSRSGESV
jgi:hypothetical protein